MDGAGSGVVDAEEEQEVSDIAELFDNSNVITETDQVLEVDEMTTDSDVTASSDRNDEGSLSYLKNLTFATMKGQQYEVKIASLLYLRGLQDGRTRQDGFYLWTNADGAGALDDVIFKYMPRGQTKYRTCFMQLKHRETSDMKHNEVLDFKYYKSYLDVEKKSKDPGDFSRLMFNNELEDCEFVFYTNAPLGATDGKLKKVSQNQSDIIEMLATGNNRDSIFTFSYESVRSHFDWISDFLNKVTIFTCQATGKVLCGRIDRELDNGLTEYTDIVTCKALVNCLALWWKRNSEEALTRSSWEDFRTLKSASNVELKPVERHSVSVCTLLFLRGTNHAEHFSLRRVLDKSFGEVVYKYKLFEESEEHMCFIRFRSKELANELDFIDADMESAFRKIVELHKGEDCEFVFYSTSEANDDIEMFKDYDVPNSNVKLFESNGEGGEVFRLKGSDIFERVTQFYSKFHVFSDQASEEDLTTLIAKDIRKLISSSLVSTEYLRDSFVKRMTDWWETKPSVDALSVKSQLWWDIALNSSLKAVLNSLNVSYIENETSDFWLRMKDDNKIHVTSQDVQLTKLKLLETLEVKCSNRYVFVEIQVLLTRHDELQTALSGNWCDVLVVDCTTLSDKPDALSQRLNVVSRDRKNVIISKFGQKLPQSLLEGFVLVEDSFNFRTLDEKSQSHLFKRNVVFQGTSEDRISVKDVVQDQLSAIQEFGSKYLRPYRDDLVVGPPLAPDIPEYISRRVSSYSRITVEAVLMNPMDTFLISNININYLRELIQIEENRRFTSNYPSDEDEDDDCIAEIMVLAFGVEVFKQECSNCHVFVIEESEADACFLLSETDDRMHWLRFDIEDNSFHLMRSVRGLGKLRTYIDATREDEFESESLLTSGNKVVLVTAEPGMGKSTLMSHIAQRLRETQPSLWVVRLNLNEHSRLLEQFGGQDCDSEYQFLSSALTPDGGPSLERELLRMRLRQYGKVVVILDGFDEIAGYYKTKGFEILKLMSESFRQVWVTSRLNMRLELEELLSTVSYTLKKITQEEQKELILKLWGKSGISLKHSETLISRLVVLINKSFTDAENDFMGIPLQTVMVAQVYKKYCSNGQELPSRINLLQLYEDFVDFKWDIFVKKSGVNVTNAYVKYIFENERKLFDKNHAMGALMALCDDRDLATLHDKCLGEKVARYFQKILECTGGTGIVDRIVDGKPMFLHRSFAEFFAAGWLAKYFRLNRDFTLRRIFQSDFHVVRHIFDRLLSRGLPLHESVIDHRVDADAVNVRDAGGRTPLHLAVLCSSGVDLQRRLLAAGVDLRARDDVLDMEAVDYAVRLSSTASTTLLVAATNPSLSQSLAVPRHLVSGYFNKPTAVQSETLTDFKTRLCGLLYLRCLNQGRTFYLGSNVDGAGSFGDIVIKYKTNDSWLTSFIQVFEKSTKKIKLIEPFIIHHANIKQSFRSTNENLWSKNVEMVAFINARYIPEMFRKGSPPFQLVKHDFILASDSEQTFRVTEELLQQAKNENERIPQDFLKEFVAKKCEVSVSVLNESLMDELRKCDGVDADNLAEAYSSFDVLFRQWWMTSDELLTGDSTLLAKSIPMKHQVCSDSGMSKENTECRRTIEGGSLKYTKLKSFLAVVSSQSYELNLLAIIYLKSLKRTTEFVLSSNSLPNKLFGVILKYKLGPSEDERKVFVHLSHKLNASTTVYSEDLLRRGHFYIRRYFKEYVSMFQGVVSKLVDKSQWCSYCCYTNAHASDELLKRTVVVKPGLVENILSTGKAREMATVKITEGRFPEIYKDLMAVGYSTIPKEKLRPVVDAFLEQFTMMFGQAGVADVETKLDHIISTTLSTSAAETACVRDNLLREVRICQEEGRCISFE